MNQPLFEQRLGSGKQGEGEIARWFQRRGHLVFPAYDVEQTATKGPRLFGAGVELTATDLLLFRHGCVFWVEAKTKAAFTWHRQTGSWQTGLDRKHWRHYLEVEERTQWPVWILFLHKPEGLAKDTPAGMVPPTGLYGNSAKVLRACVDHEHDNHGPSGMVYWQIKSLRKFSDYPLDTRTAPGP